MIWINSVADARIIAHWLSSKKAFDAQIAAVQRLVVDPAGEVGLTRTGGPSSGELCSLQLNYNPDKPPANLSVLITGRGPVAVETVVPLLLDFFRERRQ